MSSQELPKKNSRQVENKQGTLLWWVKTCTSDPESDVVEETIRIKEQPGNKNDLEPSTTIAGRLKATKRQLNPSDQVFVKVSDSLNQPKNFKFPAKTLGSKNPTTKRSFRLFLGSNLTAQNYRDSDHRGSLVTQEEKSTSSQARSWRTGHPPLSWNSQRPLQTNLLKSGRYCNAMHRHKIWARRLQNLREHTGTPIEVFCQWAMWHWASRSGENGFFRVKRTSFAFRFSISSKSTQTEN